MNERALRVGGWVAGVAGCVALAALVAVLTTGVLAAVGKVQYPAGVALGPLSISTELSMPVGFAGDICQSASVRDQDEPSDCLRFFIHDSNWKGTGPVRTQDAEVQPTRAELTGAVQFSTSEGWSSFVALSVARQGISLVVVGGVLLLLSRLLLGAARGAVFTARSVTQVRAIGMVLILGSLSEAVVRSFANPTSLGYSFETFGYGAQLSPLGAGGIDVTELVLGALVLLLGEVFRRGTAVENGQRLTV